MKINHKVIIGILKTLTVTGFVIAISIKLYNVYKYGGTTKPTTPADEDEDVDDDDADVTESYDNYPTSIKETTREYK